MSYSNINDIKSIVNKKVLFFDLETTGLVKTDRDLKPEEEYPCYKELDKYEQSRIVSIGYHYNNNFTYDNEIELDNVNEILVKPDNFVIPIESTNVHGITHEYAEQKGTKINDALNIMCNIIKECDYIVGYNVYYDVNVLLAELYRKKHHNTIKKIKELKTNKKIICVGIISSREAKPNKWYKYSEYAIPKQTKVYEQCYGILPANAHNSKFDVYAMIKILFWIHKNRINSLENVGKLWSQNDYNVLIENVNNKIFIKELCLIHKRTFGGIKCAIKKLYTDNKITKEQALYYKIIINEENNNVNRDDEIDNLFNE